MEKFLALFFSARGCETAAPAVPEMGGGKSGRVEGAGGAEGVGGVFAGVGGDLDAAENTGGGGAGVGG